MSIDLQHLEIIGTGSYLPEQIVGNEAFIDRDLWAYDSFGQKTGAPHRLTADKIFELTGIRERRKSEFNEWPSDMGYVASLRALEAARVSADSLVGIVVATVGERDNFPSAAVKIQHKLGARNVQIAYDMQNACAGFPLALIQANAQSRDFEGNWLVVGSECLTKINDYTDYNCHLFGDGAGAVVCKPTTAQRGILGVYSRSAPFNEEGLEGIDMIFRDSRANCIRMPNGGAVLKRAVGAMVDSARSLKGDLLWDKADVYIPHQANERIIAGVEKKLRSEGAIVYRTVERYGNMSSATCPVALDEAVRDGTIKITQNGSLSRPQIGDGSKVIITSFGSGLVTSAVAVQF
ncbi:MAG: 3-oxoacyl-ACP synthase III family protein [Candidatus Pacearchaeota archaeon]